MQDGSFVQQKVEPVKLIRKDHQCATSYEKAITIVDMKGRTHKAVIYYCKYEAEACTLIRFRLWPGSPTSPATAFLFGVMELQYSLFVEAQVSVLAFCNAMENMQSSSSVFRVV